MGGTGGGLVYNVEELRTIASRGLAASIVTQVLIEESVLDGKNSNLKSFVIQRKNDYRLLHRKC
jgi:carbamoyl-phosphate synthase large subunit